MTKLRLNTVTSKKELLALQRAFAEIIRRPLDARSFAPKDPRTESMIKPSKKLTPHDRIQLYAQQYWWRLQQSFDEDFPILRTILGEKRYSHVRDLYIAKFPSISFTLRHLGYRLPVFLKKNPRLTSPLTKKAIQSVEFNLARIRAFDAASLPSLRIDDIQSSTFHKKKLHLQPYVQLLELDFDFVAFSKNQQDIRGEMSSSTQKKVSRKHLAQKISIPRRKHFLAFHRFQGKLFTKECSRLEYALLAALQHGATLNSLMHMCVQKLKANPNEVSALFQNWISLGWLTLSRRAS